MTERVETKEATAQRYCRKKKKKGASRDKKELWWMEHWEGILACQVKSQGVTMKTELERGEFKYIHRFWGTAEHLLHFQEHHFAVLFVVGPTLFLCTGDGSSST